MARPDLVERFQREGEALRELNHPNIVKLLDSVEQDGHHYLILEYVAGGDLKNLLQQGPLAIETTLKIAIEIADALTRAHYLNIIHRDLKPANILITENGTARLTDFGIARVASKARITETDAIIGTIDYLSPEAFSDEGIDHRIDIWAFGVMLFEMLTGDVPFQGASIAQRIMAITTQPTPDLEALRSDVLIDLADLVYRMLEKDPDARIVSMRHVGAALEDIMQGRALHTPPETRFAAPTPARLERAKHNLPAQTTEFVGREAELSELARLLDDPKIRLITIVASGGMGKTRLSLEAAGEQIGNFTNGVFFVELAPVSDPNNIVAAIADATGYQFQSDGREQKQQILDFLANKTLLLVLDNFEHLLAGGSLVTDILHAAPHVQILATSRQRLNQSGETVFHIAGMNLPEWETPDDALESDAIALFVQSAIRVQPHFELYTGNLDAVARICMFVQGTPLGILLAASWLGMLSVEEIAAEISEGIDFLESEMSDWPERHRSMRAVFDYSWDLMSEAERDVFMKLSVFRGGFTREAAQAVSGAHLQTLRNLMNKSLIHRDAESGRYEIHELLRQYGEGRLHETDLLETTRKLYSGYYLELIHRHSKNFYGHGQPEALKAIHAELDNVRIAWQIAIDNHDEAGLGEACHLFFVFYNLTLAEEGLGTFTDALAASSKTSHSLRGKLLTGMSWFNFQLGQLEQMKHVALQSYELLQNTTEYFFRLDSQFNIGRAYMWHDNNFDAAQQELQTVLNVARLHNIRFYEGNALTMLGILSLKQGNLSRGDTLLEQGLTIHQEIGNIWGQAFSYANIVDSCIQQHKYKRAKLNAQKGLEVSRLIQLYFVEVICLLELICLTLAEENGKEAEDYCAELGYRLNNVHYDEVENQFSVLQTMVPLLQNDFHIGKQGIQSYLERVTPESLKPYHFLPCIVYFTEQKELEKAIKLLAFGYTLGDDSAHNYYLDTIMPHLKQKLSGKLKAETWQAAFESGKSNDLEAVLQELLDEFKAED